MTPIRRLIAAAGLTNLGDGIAVIAWAWAASLLTRDAVWVAMAPMAVRIPWIIGAIPAGLMADRADRRALVIAADLLRAVAFLAVACILWSAGLPEAPRMDGAPPLLFALLGAGVVVGFAEVLRDSAAATLLPALVPSHQLERANGRLWSVELVGNALAGPAIGALLIGIALAAPFLAASGLYLAGALFMLGLSARRQDRARSAGWRKDLAEGRAFLRGQPFLRQLVWITGFWNLFADMALVALVLHAQENLGLSAPIYGLVLAAGAVGGVLGGVAGEHSVLRFGPVFTARLGGVAAIPVFLIVAVAPDAIILALALAAFEFSGLLWNTVSTSYRQRRVPDAIRGRVHGIYRLVSFGAMPLGMFLSGVLVTASETVLPRDQALIVPFIVAAIGMAVANALIWRRLRAFGETP